MGRVVLARVAVSSLMMLQSATPNHASTLPSLQDTQERFLFRPQVVEEVEDVAMVTSRRPTTLTSQSSATLSKITKDLTAPSWVAELLVLPLGGQAPPDL